MTKAITKNSKKGFTLVELVIVIAILAILAAIAIPVVNSIINTASKNAALSNADTIELAIKECQADIVARNGDVYPEAASSDKRDEIWVSTVAEKKGIQEAFKYVTYNGVDYIPYWDTINDKCVFLDSAGNDITTGEEYMYEISPADPLADSKMVQLSDIMGEELKISEAIVMEL